MEKKLKVKVMNSELGRMEEKPIRIIGQPVPVHVPGMLGSLGYSMSASSHLKVLLGWFDGECFDNRCVSRHILIMDCWTNCNGYLGVHNVDDHRAAALSRGAKFFGSYANANGLWCLPNWGVDYIVMSLADLPAEQMMQLERDYARCRQLESEGVTGHRPFSKKNQKRAEVFRQSTAAAVM